jgi:hypothetical protein
LFRFSIHSAAHPLSSIPCSSRHLLNLEAQFLGNNGPLSTRRMHGKSELAWKSHHRLYIYASVLEAASISRCYAQR